MPIGEKYHFAPSPVLGVLVWLAEGLDFFPRLFCVYFYLRELVGRIHLQMMSDRTRRDLLSSKDITSRQFCWTMIGQKCWILPPFYFASKEVHCYHIQDLFLDLICPSFFLKNRFFDVQFIYANLYMPILIICQVAEFWPMSGNHPYNNNIQYFHHPRCCLKFSCHQPPPSSPDPGTICPFLHEEGCE